MSAEELYNSLKEIGLEKAPLIMKATGYIENIKVIKHYKVPTDESKPLKETISTVELYSER